MILGTCWTTWRLVVVSSFRLFSRATGNRNATQPFTNLMWFCFYQFQYKITPNVIFIVIRQRQSFIVQVDIHFIVKALPQLSNTLHTYRTSSWCNRYYKFVALCPFISIEYSSLFHLLHDRFHPLPLSSPPFYAILFVIACLCSVNIYNTIR